MHVNNKNLTLYHATDPHLFFTFNGTYSRNCNLFIVNDNKGGGTKFVASPDNTVSFATPDYQNNTYYLGTTKKQKTFKHTVAANMLSQHEVQQILQWLKVGEVGFLSYDTNPYWGWDVVVTSVGDVSQYEASDGSIIEFAVEFKTINDWHARSNYDAVKQFGSDAIDGFYDESEGELFTHSIANEYGIPEIVVDGNTIYLPQVSDEHSFLNFDWLIENEDTQCTVQINGESKPSYNYTFAAKTSSYIVNYLGQYGFSLINGKIVEDTNYLTEDSVGTSDLMILNNSMPIAYTTDADWKAGGVGAYKCSLYDSTDGTGWSTEALSNNTTPGNIYKVKIEIIKAVDANGNPVSYCNKSLGTINPDENPVKIYMGQSNILTLSADAQGTITTIKHNSL